MDHAVEGAHFPIWVCDHGEVNLVALGLLDVLLPPLMGFKGVHRQADDFDASFVELRFNFSNIPELGGADWCKIFGMREEDAPAVAQPFMKLDLPKGGVCFEVGGDIAKSDVPNGWF